MFPFELVSELWHLYSPAETSIWYFESSLYGIRQSNMQFPSGCIGNVTKRKLKELEGLEMLTQSAYIPEFAP